MTFTEGASSIEAEARRILDAVEEAGQPLHVGIVSGREGLGRAAKDALATAQPRDAAGTGERFSTPTTVPCGGLQGLASQDFSATACVVRPRDCVA